MPGKRTFTLSLLLAASAWAQTEYLPLQTGNQWMYRGKSDSFTVSVDTSATFDGRDYFLVKGFPSTPEIYLRNDQDGRILMWDTAAKAERTWVDPTADESPTGADPCNALSRADKRPAKYDGPVGYFETAIRVSYTYAGCADAGIDSDIFLPSVGLLQRSMQTIAGPRPYDLVYARLGEVTVITQAETSFGVAVDSAVKSARLTLRAKSGVPLDLTFSSGQIYEVVIKDEAGKEVWRWSDGQFFTQALVKDRIKGERIWDVSLPSLKPGRYSVEGSLVTVGEKRFAATTGVEVIP